MFATVETADLSKELIIGRIMAAGLETINDM